MQGIEVHLLYHLLHHAVPVIVNVQLALKHYYAQHVLAQMPVLQLHKAVPAIQNIMALIL